MKRRDDLGSNVLVYLRRDPAKGVPLAAREGGASPLLAAHSDLYEFNVKRCRVFVTPRIEKALKDGGHFEKTRKELLDFMFDKYGIRGL